MTYWRTRTLRGDRPRIPDKADQPRPLHAMPMAGMIAMLWRRAISDFPENGSATKRLPIPAHRPASAAEIADVLADDGVVAAFGAAFAGADVDDAGCAGP